MTTAGTVVFETLEVVEVEPGVWCPACALPAARRVVLACRVRGGTLGLCTGAQCPDCGWGIPARL